MTWFQMESEVNDMSPKNDFSDIFDDDFEVTYESIFILLKIQNK